MKSIIERNKYLIRLCLTTAVFVFIPFIIVFLIIIQRISENLYNSKYNLIASTNNVLRSIFEQEVSSSYDLAVKISVDSKQKTNSSSVLQPVVFKQNEYYYSECVKAVASYSENSQSLVGVYYPQYDILFTKNSKLDLNSFVKHKIHATDTAQVAKLENMLLQGTETLNFCSITNDDNEQVFFMAIPINMGVAKSKAIALYELSQKVFANSVIQSYGVKAIEFSVFSSDFADVVFTTDNSMQHKNIPINELDLQNITPDYPIIFTDSKLTANLFNSQVYPFKYLTIMPTDKIVQDVRESILFFVVVIFIFLLLLCLLLVTMVSINYSPIKKITKMLTKNRTEDELSAITNTLDSLITEANEKNLLLMDLLLRNLLYGLPINNEECKKLGILNKANYYAIITIYGQPINTLKRYQLVESINENYEIQFFITDILYKNHSVAICVMQNQDIEKVSNYLNKELNLTNSIFVGSTVENLDKIQQSYRDCLRQYKAQQSAADNVSEKCDNKTAEAFTDKENTDASLSETISKYVAENCANPLLSQVMVADNFGISIYSLSRLFNNEIGIGFIEYVSSLRLELAKKLLSTTEKSVSEIANDVGIQNINYFSRWFKTQTNLTPSQFRQK